MFQNGNAMVMEDCPFSLFSKVSDSERVAQTEMCVFNVGLLGLRPSLSHAKMSNVGVLGPLE